MSLRKKCDQGVYGITHTKQLYIRKPVKYEYKLNEAVPENIPKDYRNANKVYPDSGNFQ